MLNIGGGHYQHPLESDILWSTEGAMGTGGRYLVYINEFYEHPE